MENERRAGLAGFWINVKKEFSELFPDAPAYFGRVLWVGWVFGVGLVAVVLVGEHGVFQAVNETFRVFAVLALMFGVLAYLVEFDLFGLLRSAADVRATTVKFILRGFVFGLGWIAGIFFAITAMSVAGL